LHTEG